ncbi:MAG: hypothetical protein WC995_02800 [Lysobacteraceae bacterium]
MNITRMRVTEKSLLRCIRDAAKSSANVVFLPELNKRSMAGMMTFQQAMSCLRAGDIVGKPVLNEHGHWALQMQRLAANHLFTLRVIAECEGPHVKRIIVPVKVESP